MSDKITEELLNYLEDDEASTDKEIDQIWDAIKDRVNPTKNNIKHILVNADYSTQEDIFEYLESTYGRVSLDEARDYFMYEASSFEQKEMLDDLAYDLGLPDLDEYISSEYNLNVQTVEDIFKAKILVQAFNTLTLEEIENKIKL